MRAGRRVREGQTRRDWLDRRRRRRKRGKQKEGRKVDGRIGDGLVEGEGGR